MRVLLAPSPRRDHRAADQATGILSTTAQDPNDPRTIYGQALNKDGLYGPIHQHIFNVRLDLEIDGASNSVVEVDTVVPEHNPARRHVSPSSGY